MSTRQICDSIGEVAQLLQAESQEALGPYQLSPVAYAVLSRLAAAKGMRQIDLASRLLVDPSTMTRVVDRLQQDGLVTRAADPGDRRALLVRLTPAGRDRLIVARHAVEGSLAQRLGGLDEDEQRILLGLLEKLGRSARADLAEGPRISSGRPAGAARR